MSKPGADDQLHDILAQTRLPSPEVFTWASIAGLIAAILLLIAGYFTSMTLFLVFAAVAVAIGVLSALEDRLWWMVARRRFVRNAVRAGFAEDQALRFWEKLGDDDDDDDDDD